MNRVELARYIARLVGQESITLDDPGDGWPARATVQDPTGGVEPIAMHLATVGLSQRQRDDVERRLQVKGGHAIEDDGVHTPLLLGVWHGDDLVEVERPVVVAADARRRLGSITQASVFVGLANLQEAARLGWSTYQSSSGEVIACFVPELLPLFVAAARDNNADLQDHEVQAAALAAGLLDDDDDELPAARARARRAVQVLVRDGRFAARVRQAYDGCCAMCGLSMGIVEAAHIIPVGAADDDSPRNGIALCPNHHRLFDRHQVAVHPDSGEVQYHPDVLSACRRDPAIARVVDGTRRYLRRARPGADPRPGAFGARYAHFGGRYDWLGD